MPPKELIDYGYYMNINQTLKKMIYQIQLLI